MADDYTPTTEQVRTAWHDEMFPNASDAAFDRWLALHDADLLADMVTVAPDRDTVQQIVGEELEKAGLNLNGEPLCGNDEDGYWPLALELRDTLTSRLLASGVLGVPADVDALAEEKARQYHEDACTYKRDLYQLREAMDAARSATG